VKSYSLSQILLHWIVALLVLAQILNDEAIAQTWRALRNDPLAAPGALARAHAWIGVAILLLVVWRLALRLFRGAPPPPAGEPRPLRLAATATHVLLYAILLALALSGIAAWFGGVRPAADVHELLKLPLLALVALHFAGALYQQVVRRSDVLARMISPG
jgi:cytochrome b561